MLPWWILTYWCDGPAVTIHSPKTGKIVFSLLRWRINEGKLKKPKERG